MRLANVIAMNAAMMVRRRAGILAGGLWLVVALTLARANEPTLAVSGLAQPVFGGVPTNFWLAALNPTSEVIRWTFPREIVCRLNGQDAVASLADPALDTSVKIAPGQFRRLEYRLIPPQRLLGQVAVEFGSLPVNRVWLEVRDPAEMVAATPAPPLWKKVLRDAEPLDAGTGLEPGRFFKEHIYGYEPFYFIAGTESPNAKFQVSFKYQLVNEDGGLARRVPPLAGLHLAYTQTSLWDWNTESKPFYDSSYKPEMLYAWERIVGGHPTDWCRLDLQGGFQHESNGKSGADSRSLNIAYLRPTLVFGRDDYLQLTLIPRVWGYVGDLEDNPDLKDYRGYGDLRAIVGWKRGLQLSVLGRLGDDGDHGSLQFDATYPMMRVLRGSFSLYLHAQYFTGYGESLLGYQEESSIFRLGISLYR